MKLASRLVNDESEECRKVLALALQKIFVSINESSFNDIFSIAKDWLIAKKVLFFYLLKILRNYSVYFRILFNCYR